MTQSLDGLIDRLADLAGLLPGYDDVFGHWREPGREAKAALLKGLGHDPDDADAMLEAISALEKTVERGLPPVLVTWAEANAARTLVSVSLPSSASLRWRLSAAEALPDDIALNGKSADGKIAITLPLGVYRLTIGQGGTESSIVLIVAPDRCYLPPPIETRDGRIWGISVQIYSLRSRRNWGIGDYTDLAALAVKAGHKGADLIGINPLHARSLLRPEDASPYAPVSRLALDTLAIDVEAVPELGIADDVRRFIAVDDFRVILDILRETPLVDYAKVAAVKLAILRRLHDAFMASRSPQRHRLFADFVEKGGAPLRDYAAFEAIRARQAADKTPGQPWWEWPAAYRDREPESLSGQDLGPEIDFQLYLQFLAHEQLSIAAAAARAAGMRVGLYRDLAVASARDGAEAWSKPDLISKLAVGAAPDAYSETGQNWGLPATNPRQLIEELFRPFRLLIDRNMDQAGALRLDHAMALQRLFVIPEGFDGRDGTFLSFPLEAMTAVVALQSLKHACLVIGEDLGSVPKGFGEAMSKRRILAYKIVNFELLDDGSLRSPRDYPHLSVAMFSTHDMPTIAGFLQGRDIETREKVGQFTPEMASSARLARVRERKIVLDLLDREGIDHGACDPEQGDAASPAFIDAVHLLLARSSAAIAMAQIDDVLGETDAVNLPGTSTEHPNWRRKLHLDLESDAFEAAFERTARLFRIERPRRRYRDTPGGLS